MASSTMSWSGPPAGLSSVRPDALRRLTRLRQRGGRPDLLVTPVFVGREPDFRHWQVTPHAEGVTVFVSATPYFCPVHLSHGRKKSGRIRSLRSEVIKSLQRQGVINTEEGAVKVNEIVFDYVPEELVGVTQAVDAHQAAEPTTPRQFFPVIEAPRDYPSLPTPSTIADTRYQRAALKDADDGYCFGSSLGLLVRHGNRFIRALSFGRRRRGHEVCGNGRMLQITFRRPRSPRPFAIGSQCHFGTWAVYPRDVIHK